MIRSTTSIRWLVAVLLVLWAPSALTAQQRDTARSRTARDTSLLRPLEDTARVRQMVEQRLGHNVSNAELLERLRQSGLTRAEVRARLQQMGYDPGLADSYFDILERGGEPERGNASPEFLRALGRIGVTTFGLPMDSLLSDSAALDSLRAELVGRDTLDMEGIRIFGSALFRRATTQFEPVSLGPVDANYRLGPGDEIALVLTGDVEAAYTLDITREGLIFIPDVGRVSVNGITLGELEDRLYARLGAVYSGVRRGPEATTHFQVSLGRLRMNQVFLMGDVITPGAYQVSSAATVFNALYQAGGPNNDGSFRNIEVHRGSGIVATIDLYDYLLYGDSRNDIRLQNGDRVFVPPASTHITVDGSVRRPAIYEVRPDEGLRSVLAFAGGFEADALVARVQIDRILPPAQRTPGRTRVLQDVDLSVLSDTSIFVPLHDGDVVHVFTISDKLRNRVWITGEVRQPGLFEWREESTLDSLVQRASGLTEQAYLPRALIYRLDEVNGTRTLLRTSLAPSAAGEAPVNVPLQDGDSVVILSRELLGTREFVQIDGFVKNPGEYALARGMTLKDLILEAGGFIHGAYVLQAEVSRQPDPLERTDTTAIVVRVPLERVRSGSNGDDGATTDGTGIPDWWPDSEDLELRHADHVYIRKAPGYDTVQEVWITGQVLMPGRYVLLRRGERLADLIERAGGLTAEAYKPGIHVIRDGRVVAADLQRGLTDPSDRNNIELVAGDSLHVPAFDPTVAVAGAVTFNARVLYRQGESLGYYISQAGGYTDLADKGRVTVTYQSGERAAKHNVLLFFSRDPRIEPGSSIFVPAEPAQAEGFNWDQFLSRTLAVLSTTATVLIAVNQLK